MREQVLAKLGGRDPGALRRALGMPFARPSGRPLEQARDGQVAQRGVEPEPQRADPLGLGGIGGDVELEVVGPEREQHEIGSMLREQLGEDAPALEARVAGNPVVDHRGARHPVLPQAGLEQRRIGLVLAHAEAEGAGVAQRGDQRASPRRRAAGRAALALGVDLDPPGDRARAGLVDLVLDLQRRIRPQPPEQLGVGQVQARRRRVGRQILLEDVEPRRLDRARAGVDRRGRPGGEREPDAGGALDQQEARRDQHDREPHLPAQRDVREGPIPRASRCVTSCGSPAKRARRPRLAVDVSRLGAGGERRAGGSPDGPGAPP